MDVDIDMEADAIVLSPKESLAMALPLLSIGP